MTVIDWCVVGLYFALMLGVGLYFTRRASRSVADYFVSGRNLSWWLIALSAVATYTDAGLAPAVTMLTYQGGLLGNAVWWIPYVIWMPLGAVLWSKYWRRLGTVTSAEMLEIRYSGRLAHAYRGIYAAFMSLGFIVLLMGYVSGWLGAALGPILGWEPLHLMLFAGAIAAVYTVTSGLYGAAYTDAFQFGIFLAGKHHSGADRARGDRRLGWRVSLDRIAAWRECRVIFRLDTAEARSRRPDDFRFRSARFVLRGIADGRRRFYRAAFHGGPQ